MQQYLMICIYRLDERQSATDIGTGPVQSSMSGVGRFRLTLPSAFPSAEDVDRFAVAKLVGAFAVLCASAKASSLKRRSAASVLHANSSAVSIGTAAVICSQLSFLVAAYAHAIYFGQLTLDRSHISAVLDDDHRSRICATISSVGMLSMVQLELARDLPMLAVRSMLAGVSGASILATCLIRESHNHAVHVVVASLAFGAGVLLVNLIPAISRGQKFAMKSGKWLGVCLLVTGALQGMSLLDQAWRGCAFLPSCVLGALEIMLILGFTGCILACTRLE